MPNFPLRLTDELHELITNAAFLTKISKHQFCIDAIRREAENVVKDVQIPSISNKRTDTDHKPND